jgi:hypothetical protein
MQLISENMKLINFYLFSFLFAWSSCHVAASLKNHYVLLSPQFGSFLLHLRRMGRDRLPPPLAQGGWTFADWLLPSRNY